MGHYSEIDIEIRDKISKSADCQELSEVFNWLRDTYHMTPEYMDVLLDKYEELVYNK